MNDEPVSPPETHSPEEIPPPESKPLPQGHAVLAWLVILLVSVVSVLGPQAAPAAKEPKKAAGSAEQLQLLLLELQARAYIGLSRMADFDVKPFVAQLRTLNTGAVAQRLRIIVTLGELAGPEEALQAIQELQTLMAEYPQHVDPDEIRTAQLLARLFRSSRAGIWPDKMAAEDQDFLKKELGWFGELALTPRLSLTPPVAEKDAAASERFEKRRQAYEQTREKLLAPAEATAETFAGGLNLLLFAFLVGCIALLVIINLSRRGKLASGIQPRLPYAGVYAETFAIWYLLFHALGASVAYLPSDWPRLWLNIPLFFLSLLALVWPVLRGIPWQQVRTDIGWTAGRQPLIEPWIGTLTYLWSIPLALAGLLLMVGLMALARQWSAAGGGGGGDPFTPNNTPVHPVFYALAHGDFVTRIALFILLCIAAPIVEETVFRGLLYRQLREATAGRPWLSFFISGLIANFLFAVIHPQGIVGVPILLMLAFGFTIAREWRGTLIPSMIAHGINNGLVMYLAVSAAGR